MPIPYFAAIVHTLDITAPYVTRIATAAPLIEKAILAGVPIAEAIQQHGPDLIGSLKQVYTIAMNSDPTRRDQPTISVTEVTDEQVFHFAGPVLLGRRWTDEEYQRWWERDSAH